MIEENSGFALEREMLVKKIKCFLDNWREFILVLTSIFLWKKKYYPYMMTSVLLLIFIQFAFQVPTLMSAIGIIFFIVTVSDYAVPVISSLVWNQDDWNASKEREFEEICRAIATHIIYVKHGWAYLMDVRSNRPYLYFSITISSSLFLAIVGNSLSNIFVFYGLTYFIMMLPGMLHHGLIMTYYQVFTSLLLNVLRSLTSVENKRTKITANAIKTKVQ